MCDEYGPFLIHSDTQGKILGKYGPTPTQGTQPSIIKWRQPNRGFEGITRLPDGRIQAAVQSTLNVDGKSKNSAQFTRLVSFDPATGNTAMYGYPIDIASYRKAKDAKIGNIVAVDNQCTLILTGKLVNTGIELLPLEKPESLSELWVLTLPEPLR